MQASTTHFTTFNSDINPPGLGRGNAGDGDGGSANNRICDMKIDLLGADLEEHYLYTIVYSAPGYPASQNRRGFNYNGDQLGQNILRGFYVTATVSNPEVEGSTSFFCNGDDMLRTITLGDAPPEITDFNLRVEPVFGRDSSDLSEIVSNKIYLGGYWVGAQLGTIESELLATPYILGRGFYREIEYNPSDASPALFSVSVSNDFGEDSTTTEVTYVDEMAPVPGYVYSYYKVETNQTIVEWGNVQGVDEIEIYLLQDIQDPDGLLIAPTLHVNSGQGSEYLIGQFGGVLRLDYSNQYGTTTEYVEIGGSECPPFSDLCGAF